jgi:hypothetical protein
MLADEYILIILSLSAHIRLTEYNSTTLHNFNISFSIGFSCLVTEHRIPAQQKAPTLAASLQKHRNQDDLTIKFTTTS